MQADQQPLVFDGQGNLLLPGISSPNYVAGAQGWSIRRDGTAEFVNSIIAAILQTGASGNRVKIYETTRGNIKVGVVELWNDTANSTPGSVTAYGPSDGTMPSLTLTAPANPGQTDIPNVQLTFDPDGAFASRVMVNAHSFYSGSVTYLNDVNISGSLTAATVTTNTGCVPAAGFTLTSFAGTKFGNIVNVVVSLSYTGTTITSTTAGNIGDTLAATLPVGWIPSGPTHITSYDKGGVADGSVSIGIDGKCTLKTLCPNATIAAGDSVSFSMTFVN